MQKVVGLVLISLLLMSTAGFAGDTMKADLGQGPTLAQLSGTADAILNPTRFPSFYKSQPMDGCAQYLKKAYDQGGFTEAPLWVNSKFTGRGAQLSGQPAYVTIPGLSGGVEIPEKYRKTSKILITWTVRIEGFKTSAYSLKPLCGLNWYGHSWQRYPDGDAITQAWVNGKQYGSDVAMTVPASADISHIQHRRPPPPPPSSDPTLTGSVMLTKDDFDGYELPATVNVEIKWYNDTCMTLKSPANMRNVIIAVIPHE